MSRTADIVNRWHIIDAVRLTLRSLVVAGSGDYTHTLSDVAGTPDVLRRVQIGAFAVPPITLAEAYPFVGIADGGVRAEPGPSTHTYQSTGLVLVTGWVWGGPDALVRLQAAASLETDLRRALISNPRLYTAARVAGWVEHTHIASETVDGASYGEAGQHHDLQQMGVVEMTVSAQWRDKAGSRLDAATIATIQ